MEKIEKYKLNVNGIDCAGCSAKVEKEINKMSIVTEATIDFVNKKLIVNSTEKNKDKLIEEIQILVDKMGKNIKFSFEKENSVSYSKEIKNLIKKILIGIVFYIIGFLMPEKNILKFILFFISYLVIGGEILTVALKNITKGELFDENFLMMIATIGAFIIGEYPEAVAVMLFYQIGELFQSIAVNNSRKSISDLMDIRPDYANLKIGDKIQKVSPESIKVGDIIVVKPGEKVPVDAVIIEGSSVFDTSALTGESLPKEAKVDEKVLSGYINKSGLVTLKVVKEFGDSTVTKILDLVENAASKKSKTEKFITKFARYYTPFVVIVAMMIVIIPTIIFGINVFNIWLYRALVFLVVSCPCALVVSIPLGFFGGIGGASKNGLLIKGGNYLEALNNVDTIVFDKTGTLTKGVFNVTEINVFNNKITELELLDYIAHAEFYSNHPIAKSIVRKYKNNNGIIEEDKIQNFVEKSGYGIEVNVNGKSIIAGNSKMFYDKNIDFVKNNSVGTLVYVAINGKYVGNVVIFDELKETSKKTIKDLYNFGIKDIVMLTGDNKKVGDFIGEKLGIKKVFSELLPQDKIQKLEAIIKDKNNKGNTVFVGDGINDAPVLTRADIGIAMGGIGSDAAIEAADIVIMNDDPEKILTAIKISKFTKKIVFQNIVFAFAVKIIVLILGAGGLATMWEAVFADVGVALIAIFNAMRIVRKKY